MIYILFLRYGERLGWREIKWTDNIEDNKEVDGACRKSIIALLIPHWCFQSTKVTSHVIYSSGIIE